MASKGKNKKQTSKEKKVVFSQNMTCQSVLDFENLTVMVMRLTQENDLWLAGLRDGQIKMIATSGDPTSNIKTIHAPDEQSACVDIQNIPYKDDTSQEKKHRIIAVYASGFVRIWNYAGATPESHLIAQYREPVIPKPDETRRNSKRIFFNQLLTCSCSMDSKRFITGGDDCHIRVYDVNGKGHIRTCGSSFNADKVDGHTMRICALKYHPRGTDSEDYAHIFISGGWDDTIYLWDDRFAHALWIYGGPHVAGSDGLDIDPTTNEILSCSWRHEATYLQMWKFNEIIIPRIRAFTNSLDENDEQEQQAIEITDPLLESPVAEVPEEAFELRSKGYVARWIGTNFIGFGGSDINCFRLLHRDRRKPIASVNDLPSSVYGLAYLPFHPEEDKTISLAFAAGHKIYITKIDVK